MLLPMSEVGVPVTFTPSALSIGDQKAEIIFKNEQV